MKLVVTAVLAVLILAPPALAQPKHISAATAAIPVTVAHPGEDLGTIKAPAIGLDLKFQQDSGQLIPGDLPMHYAWSALPGRVHNGNKLVAIAGHHATHDQPFGQLWKLKPGESIYIKMLPRFGGHTYRYIVSGQRVVHCGADWTDCPAADGAFSPDWLDRLDLTTCDDDGFVRRFVYAYPYGT